MAADFQFWSARFRGPRGSASAVLPLVGYCFWFLFFVFFWKKLNSRNVYNWQFFETKQTPSKFCSPAASKTRKNPRNVHKWEIAKIGLLKPTASLFVVNHHLRRDWISGLPVPNWSITRPSRSTVCLGQSPRSSFICFLSFGFSLEYHCGHPTCVLENTNHWQDILIKSSKFLSKTKR